MIHLGVGLYGMVDRVPGLFHVATQFLHIYWVPVLPLRSYLILEDPRFGKGIPRHPIRFSWKSALLVWFRLALLLGGCITLPLLAATRLVGAPPLALILMVLVPPAVSLGLLALSYQPRWARPERALELAARADIPPEIVAERFVDRLRPEDEERLSNLQAEQIDPSSYSF